MTMDSTFATLVCYLLALSFAVAQTQIGNLPITPTITTPGLNLTHTSLSSSNSTVHGAVISDLTESTTPFNSTTRNNDTSTETTAATTESTTTFTSTTRNNETSTETTAATTESTTTFTSTTRNNETSTETTAATTESTSHLQTSQPASITTPLTNSTSLTTTTTTPGTPTLTTPTTQTTAGNISTPDTTIITTANSSHTVNGTTDSTERTTQGLGLNTSERNMTIVFSVVLGLFALALVAFAFHRCKHKIQYLHQPLRNAGGAGEFEADDDTLVISGGLYDGHPIYDNVPTAPADQSQFRLQFLH